MTNQLLKLLGLFTLVSGLGIGGCLNMGCSFVTKDRGDWQLTFGSQIGVSSNSSTTNANSEAGVKLDDWVTKLIEAKVAESQAAKTATDAKLAGAWCCDGNGVCSHQPGCPQPGEDVAACIGGCFPDNGACSQACIQH